MQVNIPNTNGIIKELQAQRNDAFNRAAIVAGQVAELQDRLEVAAKRIKELEALIPKEEPASPLAEAA